MTAFRTIISQEETQCVDFEWWELVVGVRASDEKEVVELRQWKRGTLIESRAEAFDRRIRANHLESVFEVLKASKMEDWIESMRHA